VKPFYEDRWVKIFLGDCREVLPTLDVKVDLVVTSPPYNMRTRIRDGEYTEREWSDHFSKKYSEFRDAFPIDEYYEIHKSVLSCLLGLSDIVFIDIQVVTGSKEAWFKIIGDFNRQLKDIVIWDKGEGQPAMANAVINRSSELIMIFAAEATAGRAFTKCYFNRGTMPDIWRIGRGGSGKVDGHAALFPEALVDKILVGWSLPNNLILDPFLGSGTTCYCAKKLNRYSIGIEMVERYAEIAAKRCMQESFEFDLLPQFTEGQEQLSL
jgi:site-specific DNA-methyltransferase (adenine-specific)/modification methylase